MLSKKYRERERERDGVFVHVEIMSRCRNAATAVVTAVVTAADTTGAVPPHASCSRWYGTTSGMWDGGLHRSPGSLKLSSPPHSSMHAGHTITPLCSQPLDTSRMTSS